ncbi:uncharacterized protein LOC119609570 [Lucilia sericata]|uniref:uncharacterized protein LOC119609570 n=1 Tax=Lucilia sericata TaxID=13632 RepID=UPI0018A7F6DA|nr:uncharacterized protein LOC119609570 [Lucilia sericata]
MFETIPKIRIFINFLLTIEICLGLAIITVTWFYQKLLATFLTDSEVVILTSKFFNAYILGFQLFASFLCALSMWSSLWPRRYTENIQLLLSVWLVYCFLIVACGAATIWSLFASTGTLSEEAEIILLKGIDNYYLKPEWKFLWDKLQYSKECCGVYNYTDWMQASWMSQNIREYREAMFDINIMPEYAMCTTTECSPYYFDNDNSDQFGNQPEFPNIPPSYGSSDQMYGQQILAPYACCKHNSSSCYANYMPHVKRSSSDSNRLPHLNLTDINTKGCFTLFTRQLSNIMDLLFILILVAVLIDILICCLTKYLMATNYLRSYREFNNDLCMFDDEGNALVVIKCPPKVKCITLEEPNTFSGSDIPNMVSSTEACQCCSNGQENVVDPDGRLKPKKKNNSYFVH